MKFAVHWAPLVNVCTPGWIAPVPAADAALGANAMTASTNAPARTRRSDIPLPSVELWSCGRSRRPRIPITQSQRGCHRAGSLALTLVGIDCANFLQGERDVVQPVQEPVLDIGVDVEARRPARP